MKKPNTPESNSSIPDHDAYFHESFKDPQAAAGLVRLAAPAEV